MNAHQISHEAPSGSPTARASARPALPTSPAWGAAGWIVLVAAVSVAPGQPSRPADGPNRTLPTVEPAYTSSARVPDEMLDPRPRRVIVLPSEPGEGGSEPRLSSGALARLTPEQQRLPEGYVLAARRASARRTGKWLLLTIEPQAGAPDAPPLRVLPNKLLAIMEAVLDAASTPPVFVVTGRVTEFQGENYILLENVAEVPRSETGQPTDPQSAGGAPAAEAEVSASTSTEGEPRAEDIVRQLMQTRPLRSVVLPELRSGATATAPAAPGTAAAGAGETGGEVGEVALWPEETMLADRAARVIAGEGGWMLLFEDRGAEARPKPIRLLPNRLLETAIALTGDGAAGVVLLISGEVTEYRRTNYLLLRKVLVRPDLGNLR